MNFLLLFSILSTIAINAMETGYSQNNTQLSLLAQNAISKKVSPKPLFCEYTQGDGYAIGMNSDNKLAVQIYSDVFQIATPNVQEKNFEFGTNGFSHDPAISLLSWNSEGKHLISTGGTRVKTWHLDDQNNELSCIKQSQFPAKIAAASWHPDGTKFALVHENSSIIHIFDQNGNEVFQKHTNCADLSALCWNLRNLIVGTKANKLLLFNNHPLQNENAFSTVTVHNPSSHPKAISTIASHKNGTIFAYCIEDQDNIYLANDNPDQQLVVLLQKKPTQLKWSNASNILAALYKGNIRLWNTQRHEIIATLKPNHNFIVAFDIHPHNSYLISLAANEGTDLWDLSTIQNQLYGNLSTKNIQFLNDYFGTKPRKKLILWSLDPEQEKKQKEEYQSLPEAYRSHFEDRFLVEKEKPEVPFSLFALMKHFFISG